MASASTIAKSHRRPRRVTVAQYMAMPDDGRRYELYHGILVMSPSAFYSHGRVILHVGGQMSEHAKKRKSGVVGIETDVVVSKDTVLRPDINFVSTRNRRVIRGHIYGPPELVVEVTSPSNWQRDVYDKRDEYERFGIKEYWVLDIAEGRKRAFQWSIRGGQYRGGQVEGPKLISTTLRGFELKLKDVWELAED